MTEHPITPPPELVEQWVQATESNDCIGAFPTNFEQRICTAAARWGADQELEACCQALRVRGTRMRCMEAKQTIDQLRAARRSKPPTLKEQALAAQQRMWDGTSNHDDWNLIRRALEQLDD